MAGKGETVKYYIDADTSGFTRGMAESALAADVAGNKIDRSLSRASKRSENNFKDIRANAATAASSIRNFGVAMQGFNLTAAIIGVTALSGALIELSGAIAAAGTTASVLVPIFAQFGAGALAAQAGMFGLNDAFKAIGKNDGKAFAESLQNLGPAAREVAFAVGGLNQAMNGLRLNAQNALLQGVGDTLLRLGSQTLPTVNAGFQIIGQAMNRAFKEAAKLAGSPAFSSLMARIFQDTARSVDTLSGAMAPLLTIFTNMYLITAPYLQLLNQYIVSLAEAGAAYLSTTKGQTAFNLAIAEGVIALQQIGGLISAVFGFLTSIFRTSIISGTSLITTITQIVNSMTAWVNSAEGQAQLSALFQFTALTIRTVADALGQALGFFFSIIQAINSLNPAIQQMIVGFLASALTIRPILTYFSQLYLAIRVVAVTAFNLVQQAIVMAGALGAFGSIALVVAGVLMILASIIKGPLGAALLIVGGAIALYIGLNYALTAASSWAAGAMLRQGYAAIYTAQLQAQLASMNGIVAATMLQLAGAAGAAGAGLGLAARGAMLLQAALVPLLVLAAGVLIILGMLGVFSGKAKAAQGASIGLGSSLGSLQQSLKGVGASGNKASAGGLSALNDSLGSVGEAAQEAQKGLAGFDKMNVLTDKTAGGAGDMGLPAMPSMPAMPDLGGAGGGAIPMPDLDTADFEKSLLDMQKQFDDLRGEFDNPFANPFAAIGEFISANPVPFFIAFAVILGVIIALFATGAVTIGLATLPLTLIVIAIIAIIAIIILLVQNWTTVWGVIQDVVANVGSFIQGIFEAVGKFIGDVLTNIGNFFATIFAAIWVAIQFYINLWIEIFKLAFTAVTTVWNAVVAFFKGLWDGIVAGAQFLYTKVVDFFKLAWEGVKIIWAVVKSYFSGVWDGIKNVFAAVGSWFGNIFSGAWTAIKNAFASVGGFFRGVWDTITGIFGKIGTTIGNAIGGAFKGVVNAVLNTVSNVVNTVIDLINGAIDLINAIPGVDIGKIPRVNLPRMAKGGIVDRSTIAEIGENGTEAVMPLENNTGWIDKLADRINSSNGNNGGQPLQLVVQIGEDKIATKIIDLINEKTQMSGRNSIIV